MTDTKQQVERRKHIRFSVAEDTFVALRPHYYRIGKVLNISIDGLAFTYMVDGKPPGQSFALDIFLDGRTFFLKEVPFITIADVACDEIPLGSVETRRMHVQFENLTSHQKDELESFIRNHSMLGFIYH
jgi:hypothetical protein